MDKDPPNRAATSSGCTPGEDQQGARQRAGPGMTGHFMMASVVYATLQTFRDVIVHLPNRYRLQSHAPSYAQVHLRQYPPRLVPTRYAVFCDHRCPKRSRSLIGRRHLAWRPRYRPQIRWPLG